MEKEFARDNRLKKWVFEGGKHWLIAGDVRWKIGNRPKPRMSLIGIFTGITIRELMVCAGDTANYSHPTISG
jgi:hypothetical protein